MLNLVYSSSAPITYSSSAPKSSTPIIYSSSDPIIYSSSASESSMPPIYSSSAPESSMSQNNNILETTIKNSLIKELTKNYQNILSEEQLSEFEKEIQPILANLNSDNILSQTYEMLKIYLSQYFK